MRLQKIRGISVLPATLRSRDCPLKDELLCPTKAELPEGLPDVGLEMEREVVEVEGVKGHTRCAPPRRGLGEHLEWPLQGWGWGVCRRGAVWKEDQLPGSGQGAGGGTCLNFSIDPTQGSVISLPPSPGAGDGNSSSRPAAIHPALHMQCDLG